MQLDTEFVRLPLTFDAGRLAEEIARFDEADWRPHPQGYPGNSALALIAAGGNPNDDEVKGPMRETPHLARSPYLRQVLGAFHAVWGRTRLMRLDGNAEATPHSDTNYYWTQHARVHVPIVTSDGVQFRCGDRSVHMRAGEAWIFDTWQLHNVVNPHPARRIHLVADTIGSAAFWSLVERGKRHEAATHVAYDPLRGVQLATESFNHPVVMPPAEQHALIELVLSTLDFGEVPRVPRSSSGSSDTPSRNSEELRGTPRNPATSALDVRNILRDLEHDWRAAWARFGESREGWPLYRQLLARAEGLLAPLHGTLRLRNGVDAVNAIRSALLRPALDDTAETQPQRVARRTQRRIERPLFIISPPRSGSTMFFETLSRSPTLWTIGGESHGIIEGIKALQPQERGWHSNRLTESDATHDVVTKLEDDFVRALRNRAGQAPRAGATGLRLLEKTPKNSLRVPFLAAAFPDALFLYLYRDMRDTISSMLDAWRSGKFVTYPQLPGWEGPPWSLLLTPGWRDLAGKPLAEIVAAQWSTATRYLLDDLEQLPPERWAVASYDALANDPQPEIDRIARFAGIEWDRQITEPLPLSRATLTAPDREKWRRNAADLDVALPLVEEVAARARNVFGNPPKAEPKRVALSTPPAAKKPDEAFRSVHTSSFPELLARISSSLIVTTYQSGRVILVRNVDGALNTHLRSFPSPMGVAVTPKTLALGTKQLVWQFRRQGEAYFPASAWTTGDIRVHELAYAGEQLVIVNTRFSCLATLDGVNSFRPIWQPSFITELLPEDRCHLNGVAVAQGRIRFVTALGETNVKGGWRANKGGGGIVIDVPSGELIARGLSMPHSPRWYDGKLWLLESGEGRLCTLDPVSGAKNVVAELPGFTRGLAFAGPYAFVGLSQIRESVFDGLPIAQRTDRSCGVWIVDVRDGSIAGFLRFEGNVQEIFDVQLLEGLRQPDLFGPDDEQTATTIVLPRAAQVTA